jgi:hypothetical protein
VNRYGYQLFCTSLFCVALSGHSCCAQAGQSDHSATTCFQVFQPQRHTLPATPLLLNRCTGETWILVRRPVGTSNRKRSQEPAFRWIALEVDQAIAVSERKDVNVSSRPVPRKSLGVDGRKCFFFTGREFCE